MIKEEAMETVEEMEMEEGMIGEIIAAGGSTKASANMGKIVDLTIGAHTVDLSAILSLNAQRKIVIEVTDMDMVIAPPRKGTTRENHHHPQLKPKIKYKHTCVIEYNLIAVFPNQILNLSIFHN